MISWKKQSLSFQWIFQLTIESYKMLNYIGKTVSRKYCIPEILRLMSKCIRWVSLSIIKSFVKWKKEGIDKLATILNSCWIKLHLNAIVTFLFQMIAKSYYKSNIETSSCFQEYILITWSTSRHMASICLVSYIGYTNCKLGIWH